MNAYGNTPGLSGIVLLVIVALIYIYFADASIFLPEVAPGLRD